MDTRRKGDLYLPPCASWIMTYLFVDVVAHPLSHGLLLSLRLVMPVSWALENLALGFVQPYTGCRLRFDVVPSLKIPSAAAGSVCLFTASVCLYRFDFVVVTNSPCLTVQGYL